MYIYHIHIYLKGAYTRSMHVRVIFAMEKNKNEIIVTQMSNTKSQM